MSDKTKGEFHRGDEPVTDRAQHGDYPPPPVPQYSTPSGVDPEGEESEDEVPAYIMYHGYRRKKR